MSGVDLVTFLRARLDEVEWWAREASRRGENYTESGEHWRWEDGDTDQPITVDPAEAEHIGEGGRVGLRSLEEYPTHSVGPLPHMPLEAEEVEAATAGHIVRHDPARVLREVEAKRRILDEHWPEFGSCPRCVKEPAERSDEGARLFVAAAHTCTTVRLLALPEADHPDYDPSWAPAD